MLKFLLVWLMLFTAPGCALTKDIGAPGPLPPPAKVNLVWQHADRAEVDLSRLDQVVGVNVVSPCWYVIDRADGHITDKSVSGYVERAHVKGYRVWPLITNSFDENLTRELLNNPAAQDEVIRQLLEQAAKHNLDGINLDFESVYEEDKDALTKFTQKITQELKQRKLTVSMDVTVPSSSPLWSRCYDRQALGETVDYLMIMAYDQYVPSGHQAGPTAAYDWVEPKLKEILAQVPAQKIVLGLPLYMRLWSTDADGYTKGRTLSMPEAEQLITQKGVLESYHWEWQPDKKLFYHTYQEDGLTYVFWQENAETLRYKADLARRFDLAGLATWRKGFETPDVWPVLAKKLRRNRE